MTMVLRALGLLLVGASVLGLLAAIRVARQELPIKPRFDVVRLAFILGAAVGITAVLAVETSPPLIAGAFVGGGVLGLLQARSTEFRTTPEGIVARRSALGVLVWGVGLVIANGAGIADKAGTVQIGLAVSYFSAGMVAGTIAGRQQAITRATPPTAVAAMWLLVALVAIGSSPQRAEAKAPACPIIDGLEALREAGEHGATSTAEFLICKYSAGSDDVFDVPVSLYAGWLLDDSGFVDCGEQDASERTEGDAELGSGALVHGYAYSTAQSANVEYFIESDDIDEEAVAAGVRELLTEVESFAVACPSKSVRDERRPQIPTSDALGVSCPQEVAGIPLVDETVDVTFGYAPARDDGYRHFVCSYSNDEQGFLGDTDVLLQLSWLSPDATPATLSDELNDCAVAEDASETYGEVVETSKTAVASFSVIDTAVDAPRTELEAGAQALLDQATGDAATCPELIASVTDEAEEIAPATAASASLIGLAGSAGVLGSSLSEAGISPGRAAGVARRDGWSGLRHLLDAPSDQVTGDLAEDLADIGAERIDDRGHQLPPPAPPPSPPPASIP